MTIQFRNRLRAGAASIAALAVLAATPAFAEDAAEIGRAHV